MIDIKTKQLIKRLIGKTTGFFLRSIKLSVILNYHSVHPTHSFATKPADFIKQMDYLRSNFQVVSLSDFYNMRVAKCSFPDKLAIVTFDDGYADNYKYAFPILKEFGIKATIFLTTGFIDGMINIAERDKTYSGLTPLTWEEIAKMKEWGISFGAHTHNHKILSQISLKEAEKEILTSKTVLENRLGLPVEYFAYPLGQAGTFTCKIIDLLKKYGFKLACTTIWGSNNSNIDLFLLRRVRIDAWDSFHDFKEKVNGNWDFIRWFQLFRAF